MGFLARVRSPQSGLMRRASTPSAWDDFWYSSPGFPNSSGIYVTPELAMTLSAFWQGSRLIGEGLGGMPCQFFKRKDEDGRTRVRGPGLPYMLRWQPNPFQTAFEFWQDVAVCRVHRGIFIAEQIAGPLTGYADALAPIHPDLVTASRLPNGRVAYTIRETGGKRTLSQDEVFVVRGFTEADGVTPMSLIRYAAQSLGVMLAGQAMAGTFFTNGVTPSLAVISEDELGPTGIDNLHKSIMAYVGGRRGSFGVLPLEGGVKLEKLGLTPHDVQLAAMMNMGVEDVARWLNIPLHMLRFSNQGTGSYASLEVFSAEFVTYTLRPYAIACEQAVQRDLILEQDREEVFVEFNMDALLRGDLASRYSAYRVGIMSGFLTRNEARIKENLDPADGLDEFWSPMNMTSVDNSVGGQGDKEPRGSQAQQALSAIRGGREAYRMVCLAREVAGKLVRKEMAVVERLGREQAKDGVAWKKELQAFYAKFADEVAHQLQISKAAAREYAEAHGQALQARGIAAMESWDAEGVEALAVLALTGGDRVAA